MALTVLLARGVPLAPSALDDEAQLRALVHAPFARVFSLDHFGHLRPAKSALFWVLAHHPTWFPYGRGLVLGAVIASAVLWQLLCTELVRSWGWGLGVALGWVLNPVCATVLCWLSSANLALCGLGMLVFVLLAERERRVGALIALLFALACHELALLTPLLWLAYRRARGEDIGRRSLPLLAATGALVIAWLVYAVTREPWHTSYRAAQHPRALLMLSAARYVFENLRLWFWLPGRFGVLLSDEPALHAFANIYAWIGLGAIGFLVWRVRDPVLGFAAFWTFASLAPLTNFAPLGNTPVAMHYLYLPGLGLSLFLARSVQRLATALPMAAAWLPVLAWAAYIGVLWPVEQRAFASWADTSVLYQRTIEHYPDDVEARVNLSAIYLDAQRYSEAEALLASSLERWPNELGLIANQFKLLADTGHSDEALAWHDAHPGLHVPAAWMLRGSLLTQNGHHREAAEAFERAYETADGEERFAAGYQLAIALVRSQRFADAKYVIDRLLVEFPGRPELTSAKQLLSEQAD